MKKYIAIAAIITASVLILAATAFKLVAAEGATHLAIRPSTQPSEQWEQDEAVIIPIHPPKISTLVKFEVSSDLKTWRPVTNYYAFTPLNTTNTQYLRITKAKNTIRF